MRKAVKPAVLFLVGGTIYYLLESGWKSYTGKPTHWTMFVLGGLLFLAIGAINEYIPWETGFFTQAIIGAAVITGGELIAGIILNLWLGLGIWDYSHLPLNILGQICLPFCLLWILAAAFAIVLDDWLRWRLFGEERPHYRFGF
ncbi:MAG: hypothetical protein IJ497_04885 [Clostridia bacterium]|nr:hypothetical protein [Clostridia bacterium]